MKQIKKYITHILCMIVAVIGLSSCIATRPVDTVYYYDTYPRTYIVVPNGTYRPPVRSPYHKPHVVRRPPVKHHNNNHNNHIRNNNNHSHKGGRR